MTLGVGRNFRCLQHCCSPARDIKALASMYMTGVRDNSEPYTHSNNSVRTKVRRGHENSQTNIQDIVPHAADSDGSSKEDCGRDPKPLYTGQGFWSGISHPEGLDTYRLVYFLDPHHVCDRVLGSHPGIGHSALNLINKGFQLIPVC